MSSTANAPDIKVEVLSAPAVKEMTVSPIGQNMFSIGMNIIVVVRFPSENPTTIELTSPPAPVGNTTDEAQIMYADGTTPQAEGEKAAFNDFTNQHGYPPQTREILAEWVKLQQGVA